MPRVDAKRQAFGLTGIAFSNIQAGQECVYTIFTCHMMMHVQAGGLESLELTKVPRSLMRSPVEIPS